MNRRVRNVNIPDSIKAEIESYNSGHLSDLSEDTLFFTAIKLYGCNFGYFNGKLCYSGGKIFDNDYKNRQLKLTGVYNG